MVAGRIAPSALAGTHKTLEGSDLTVTGSGTSFTVNGDSEVVFGNVQTANATVYIVDHVLTPPASLGCSSRAAVRAVPARTARAWRRRPTARGAPAPSPALILKSSSGSSPRAPSTPACAGSRLRCPATRWAATTGSSPGRTGRSRLHDPEHNRAGPPTPRLVTRPRE